MRPIIKRVVRKFSLLILAVALASMITATSALAATIFESGTLGPTGVTRSDIANETVAGTNVSAAVFVGVRFLVDRPVITTDVGGHFVKNLGADESFFGAIVALDDANDFPNSGDLSTPDVVGSTLLAFPELSDEVFGDLVRSLDPGWYALVFGSGLFGATGSGVAVRNGTDIDDPAYIAFQPGTDWFNLSDLADVVQFVNHRFVVLGSVIPEPSSLALVMICALCFIWKRTHFARR